MGLAAHLVYRRGTDAPAVRVDPRAAALLVPYLVWVGFAALPNYEIWRVN